MHSLVNKPPCPQLLELPQGSLMLRVSIFINYSEYKAIQLAFMLKVYFQIVFVVLIKKSIVMMVIGFVDLVLMHARNLTGEVFACFHHELHK